MVLLVEQVVLLPLEKQQSVVMAVVEVEYILLEMLLQELMVLEQVLRMLVPQQKWVQTERLVKAWMVEILLHHL